MQRVLTFDGARGAKRFEMCRVAILNAGDGKGERTREVLRREARLFEALDGISVAAPATPDDPEPRTLVPGAGPIAIRQEDHELLTKYTDTTRWVPRVARDAVDLQDWLGAAERVD